VTLGAGSDPKKAVVHMPLVVTSRRTHLPSAPKRTVSVPCRLNGWPSSAIFDQSRASASSSAVGSSADDPPHAVTITQAANKGDNFMTRSAGTLISTLLSIWQRARRFRGWDYLPSHAARLLNRAPKTRWTKFESVAKDARKRIRSVVTAATRVAIGPNQFDRAEHVRHMSRTGRVIPLNS
jgi:hypothetical protein